MRPQVYQGMYVVMPSPRLDRSSDISGLGTMPSPEAPRQVSTFQQSTLCRESRTDVPLLELFPACRALGLRLVLYNPIGARSVRAPANAMLNAHGLQREGFSPARSRTLMITKPPKAVASTIRARSDRCIGSVSPCRPWHQRDLTRFLHQRLATLSARTSTLFNILKPRLPLLPFPTLRSPTSASGGCSTTRFCSLQTASSLASQAFSSANRTARLQRADRCQRRSSRRWMRLGTWSRPSASI